MKIIEGFKMRTIAGESVVVGEGMAQINFNKLISLNSSAALFGRASRERSSPWKICATPFSRITMFLKMWQGRTLKP